MLLLLCSLWSAHAADADADRWTVSGALGGEINADPHGIANVAATRGPWQLSWITDTADLRYAPSDDRGRAWVAARVATFAAGMVISPWVDGAPAPDLAMQGLYAGVEGGGIRYLPHGAYVGGQALVRWHTFYGDRTDKPVGRLHAQPQALGGWWSPWLHAWTVVGVDLQQSPDGTVSSASPHSRGQAVLEPRWTLAPLLEVRAGWGEDQDIVTLTRVGGLNPYVVPLAGAAWAEWWVQDYAAARAGAVLHTEPVDLAAFVDAAVFDGPQGSGRATGFGLAPTFRIDPVLVHTAVGTAPFIERPDGQLPLSGYVLISAGGGE